VSTVAVHVKLTAEGEVREQTTLWTVAYNCCSFIGIVTTIVALANKGMPAVRPMLKSTWLSRVADDRVKVMVDRV